MIYKEVSSKSFCCSIFFAYFQIVMLMAADKARNIIRLPLSKSLSRERNLFIFKEEPVHARNVRQKLADYSISWN